MPVYECRECDLKHFGEKPLARCTCGAWGSIVEIGWQKGESMTKENKEKLRMVALRLDAELYDRLKELAERECRTIPAMVIYLIKAGLQEKGV